jgi:uncharacterized repeat protein (TIGR01451 family)
MILTILAVGQAGTMIAGATPPADTSGSPAAEAQPAIVDTQASSDDCVELGVDQSCAIDERGAEASDPADTTVTVDEPCDAIADPADASASNESGEATEDVVSNDVTSTVACEEATQPDLQEAQTSPDLQVTKSSDADGLLDGGDNFRYTITVTNVGDEEATGVELVDVLPAEAVNVGVPFPVFGGKLCNVTSSVLPGGVPYAEIRCGPITLDPGGSASITVRAIVSGDVCGSITNEVDVDGTNEPAENAGDNHAEATDEIACVPRIRLLKSGPSAAHVGDTIAYVFVARNNGGVDLTNIGLSDPKCDGSPGLIEDADGDSTLAVGERWRFTCDHTVTAGDGTVVHNLATVTGDHEGGTVKDTDTHDVDVIHPSIDLEMTATPTAGPAGTLIVYTYTVRNTGDTPLFDISVDDDQLDHIGDIPSLAAGATAELTAEITLGSSPITNLAIASGEDRLGGSVSDDASATVTVVSGGGGADGGDGTGGGTPFTGSGAGGLGAWIVVLAALGSALLMTSRKRPRSPI